MESPHLDRAPVHHRHRVRRASEVIERELAGTFSRGTVQRFVATSRAQLVPTARVTGSFRTHGRSARERLGAPDRVEGPEVDAAAVEATTEVGIRHHRRAPGAATHAVVRAADVAVAMRRGDARPVLARTHDEDRVSRSSPGTDVVSARAARDELRARVERLVASRRQGDR